MMQSMGLCDALEPGDPKGTHRYRPIWSPLGLAVKARLEEATPAATALRQEQEWFVSVRSKLRNHQGHTQRALAPLVDLSKSSRRLRSVPRPITGAWPKARHGRVGRL